MLRRNAVEEHLVSLLAPASFEAEQYRVLRHIVEQFHKENDIRVLGVTSPAAGDGKTTTALNLAGALAQAPDARVLLIDADVRRGLAGTQLGLRDTSVGLVETILDPKISLARAVCHCAAFNLSVLPNRPGTNAPYEVLKSPRLGALLDEARQQYDYVVVDVPPVVPVPDCRLIAKHLDGFLVVVAAHKTPRKLVDEALDVLDPAKVLGLVFNVDDDPLSSYGASSYYQPYGADFAHPRYPAAWQSTVTTLGRLTRRLSSRSM